MSSHSQQFQGDQPADPTPQSAPVAGSTERSRRSFLSVAAGTLMASALASGALARSKEPGGSANKPGGPIPKAKARIPLAPDQTIRMAVIGTGGMGTGHVDAFMSLAKAGKEKVEIVGVCDVNQKFLDRAHKKCVEGQSGVECKKHADYKEILARDDVHAVLIASPEHWHAQMAIDAIVAGKDVYLEKPMTLRLDEALRLREVVRGNPDMRLQVGTQMTNLPKYHEARKVIESGLIGVPCSSQTSYCRNAKEAGEWNYYELDPEWAPGKNLDWNAWCGPMGQREWDPKVYIRWRRYRDFSTGILGDLLVHVITPMLVAIEQGWPTRVVAVGSHMVDKAMENHDMVNLAIQFETGHQMIVAGSTCNEVGLETMIKGNKGNIYLNSRHCVVRPERGYSEEFDEKTIECADIGNDQDMHRLKWLKVIRTREQPDSDVDQGAKVVAIVDLATRSIWEGAAFEFDPKTMTSRKV